MYNHEFKAKRSEKSHDSELYAFASSGINLTKYANPSSDVERGEEDYGGSNESGDGTCNTFGDRQNRPKIRVKGPPGSCFSCGKLGHFAKKFLTNNLDERQRFRTIGRRILKTATNALTAMGPHLMEQCQSLARAAEFFDSMRDQNQNPNQNSGTSTKPLQSAPPTTKTVRFGQTQYPGQRFELPSAQPGSSRHDTRAELSGGRQSTFVVMSSSTETVRVPDVQSDSLPQSKPSLSAPAIPLSSVQAYNRELFFICVLYQNRWT